MELILNNCKQKRWYFLSADYRLRDPKRYDRIQYLLAKGKYEEAEKLRYQDWKTWTVRPHDLRHTYCTMLVDAGVPLKQAMAWLGHADEKMILRVYDHVTDFRVRSAIAEPLEGPRKRQRGIVVEQLLPARSKVYVDVGHDADRQGGPASSERTGRRGEQAART